MANSVIIHQGRVLPSWLRWLLLLILVPVVAYLRMWQMNVFGFTLVVGLTFIIALAWMWVRLLIVFPSDQTVKRTTALMGWYFGGVKEPLQIDVLIWESATQQLWAQDESGHRSLLLKVRSAPGLSQEKVEAIARRLNRPWIKSS